MKYIFIDLLGWIRRTAGRGQCLLLGRCDSDADVYEIEENVARFYGCVRCERDVGTGQTLREWCSENVPF